MNKNKIKVFQKIIPTLKKMSAIFAMSLAFLFSIFSHKTQAKIVPAISKEPRTYLGFATINKSAKEIKFETPQATLYFQLSPVAIRNQFEFKTYKPNREIILKVHDSEIIRIEPRPRKQSNRIPASSKPRK